MKIIKKISSFILAFTIAFPVIFLDAHNANSEEIYPYTKTFKVSAYYSPLPCQVRYATGNYHSDIRLNGSGVRGADGTPVYAGMVAAPRSYAFGTKMLVPGIGMTAVHDRGGAIVNAGERSEEYDRLDVWMGYGDKGLERALKWGKRVVDITLYGPNESIVEAITLPGYSPDEAIPNDCVMEQNDPVEIAKVNAKQPVVKTSNGELASTLTIGSSGSAVFDLQHELARLNYYRGDVTGFYGELTEHAVFKFQQSQGIVKTKNDVGAGVFGPQTRVIMNRFVAARNYRNVLVAEANPESLKVAVIAKELDYGISDPEVSKLQKFLKSQGYFNGILITDYFGDTTKEALLKFQIEKGLVDSEDDSGAGRVGPSTIKLINSLS
ncbi:hypothetical protein COU74_03270 [Candidatus Peregrinibacteria bacterium CG10_big_fil_rev_8_21_14_0_10_36_19]|nr:MAG: hypothetical protein COU74_03270 [Candidatus Peregrinibacteria bacterium CG10_big_fil_rev_8_21_14_0_10_36_19]